MINAWSDLKKMSEGSLEEGRNELIERMSEYHSYTGAKIIIVFDAYQGKETKVSKDKINGVEIVFTKKNQTADSYIEREVAILAKDRRNVVRVVTSDWAEQQVILGSGGIRVLPRELKYQYDQMKTKIRKKVDKAQHNRMNLGDRIDTRVVEILEKWRKEKG